MPTTVTIELGGADNPGQCFTQGPGNKVKFTNTTNVPIILTTPTGMRPSPSGGTEIAAGATETHNGFTISNNAPTVLTYSWDDKVLLHLATRTGIIRVT